MGPAWGCQRLRSVFKTMREAMTALLAQSKDDALAIVQRLVRECADGISDRESEAEALAKLWLLDVNVEEEFREARLLRPSFIASVEAKAEPAKKPTWLSVRPLSPPTDYRERYASAKAAAAKVERANVAEPEPEPKPAINTVADVGPPKKIQAAQKVSEEPEAKSGAASGISVEAAVGKTELVLNSTNLRVGVAGAGEGELLAAMNDRHAVIG